MRRIKMKVTHRLKNQWSEYQLMQEGEMEKGVQWYTGVHGRERERGRVIYILTGWWYFARIEIAFCDEKREKGSSPSAV